MSGAIGIAEQAIRLVGMDTGLVFKSGFYNFLINHGDAWLRFYESAEKIRERGIKNYSAFVIVNVLRYRADLEGRKFAMTNTYVPDFARLYNMMVAPIFNVSTRKKERA